MCYDLWPIPTKAFFLNIRRKEQSKDFVDCVCMLNYSDLDARFEAGGRILSLQLGMSLIYFLLSFHRAFNLNTGNSVLKTLLKLKSEAATLIQENMVLFHFEKTA